MSTSVCLHVRYRRETLNVGNSDQNLKIPCVLVPGRRKGLCGGILTCIRTTVDHLSRTAVWLLYSSKWFGISGQTVDIMDICVLWANGCMWITSRSVNAVTWPAYKYVCICLCSGDISIVGLFASWEQLESSKVNPEDYAWSKVLAKYCDCIMCHCH